MNHTSPPPSRRLRRISTIVGGSVAGVTAALMFAAPALACHPEISGKAVCDENTGEWVVTWTAAKSDNGNNLVLSNVQYSPSHTPKSIKDGAELPLKSSALTEVQRVSADTGKQLGKATLTYKWSAKKKGGSGTTQKAEAQFKGTCEKPSKPSPSPTPSPEAPESPAPPPSSPEAPESPAPSVTPSESSSPSPVTPDSPAPSVSVTPVSNDGSLPVTGSSIATAIGISVGLLAIGAGLFYVFRRRRLRFTA